MSQENTTPRIRGVSRVVQQAATVGRGRMTPAEARLWEEIRSRKLGGLRFRAQHPVGPFILDFYCPACKLALEIDGSSHDGEAEQDAARTAQLAAHGYRVLRFTNAQIGAELADVLGQIQRAAEEEEGRPPSGRPEEEEGRPPRPNSGEPEGQESLS